MLVFSKDPILKKIQSRLEKYKIESEIVENEKLDFEYDYRDIALLGTIDGVGSVGTLKLKNFPIDYFHVVKQKKMEKCEFAPGGNFGMGMHEHSTWKIRYFLSFDDSIMIGPLNMGTLTTIKKSHLRSKVEDFEWNGYQRLTTLPPGLIRDNVAEKLYEDNKLKELMLKNLLKERIITISIYSPKKIASEKNAKNSGSKIMITHKWKFYNELLAKKDTIDMYQKIASIIKEQVKTLQYHLK